MEALPYLSQGKAICFHAEPNLTRRTKADDTVIYLLSEKN